MSLNSADSFRAVTQPFLDKLRAAQEKYLEGIFGSIELAKVLAGEYTLVEWTPESIGDKLTVKWQLMTNEQADAFPEHIYPPSTWERIGHTFQFNGHPDHDDECCFRADGTDVTYCGRPKDEHN